MSARVSDSNVAANAFGIGFYSIFIAMFGAEHDLLFVYNWSWGKWSFLSLRELGTDDVLANEGNI